MTAWDDVREGDLVRVTNGETSGTGRVFMGAIIDSLHLSLVDDSNGLMRYMKDEGYTLEIIEKATVSLPTEAGIYTDREGSIWQCYGGSSWVYMTSFGNSREYLKNISKRAAEYAPFTRLTPEGE